MDHAGAGVVLIIAVWVWGGATYHSRGQPLINDSIDSAIASLVIGAATVGVAMFERWARVVKHELTPNHGSSTALRLPSDTRTREIVTSSNPLRTVLASDPWGSELSVTSTVAVSGVVPGDVVEVLHTGRGGTGGKTDRGRAVHGWGHVPGVGSCGQPVVLLPVGSSAQARHRCGLLPRRRRRPGSARRMHRAVVTRRPMVLGCSRARRNPEGMRPIGPRRVDRQVPYETQ